MEQNSLQDPFDWCDVLSVTSAALRTLMNKSKSLMWWLNCSQCRGWVVKESVWLCECEREREYAKQSVNMQVLGSVCTVINGCLVSGVWCNPRLHSCHTGLLDLSCSHHSNHVLSRTYPVTYTVQNVSSDKSGAFLRPASVLSFVIWS